MYKPYIHDVRTIPIPYALLLGLVNNFSAYSYILHTLLGVQVKIAVLKLWYLFFLTVTLNMK